jgi:hypothetical protein
VHHFLNPSSFTPNQKKTMESKSLLRKINGLLATSLLLLGVVIAMGTMLVAFNTPNAQSTPEINLSQEQLISRGAYLVNTSGCNDCHSPKVMTPSGPEPDPERLLSGHPSFLPLPVVDPKAIKDWVLFNQHSTGIVGPWGASFAANITSDETGIGNWSEEQFFRAIRKGKFKGLDGGRTLLPPMPWQVYGNMTDTDLRAMFAYLKSTKPVHNIVPPPIPPDQIK